MRPEVITHNTVSLDGAVSHFPMDMGLHYELAATYGAQAHLVGSATARSGIESEGFVPREEAEDREPRPIAADDPRPLWVIPDSRGRLVGLLHVFRRFEHCKEVVVLHGDDPPPAYLDYLETRGYPHHAVGDDRVDLARGLEVLKKAHDVSKVLTDSGGTLVSLLLGAGLVDEVSLVVSPHLAGPLAPKLFREIQAPVALELVEHAQKRGDAMHCRYRVLPREPLF